MVDASGSYTLNGITGSPITAIAGADQAVTYNIEGSSDIFSIEAEVGAVVTIHQTVTSADTINLQADGGTISLSSAEDNDTFAITIQHDGSFITNGYFGSSSPLGSVTFGDEGGALVVGISGTYRGGILQQGITGFASVDNVIDDQSLLFSGITGYTIENHANTGQSITVDATTGNFSFTTTDTSLATGSYTSLTSGPLSLFRDSTRGTNISLASCFLDDVLIATPYGDVSVQHLRAGDLLYVSEQDNLVARPVLWVGRQTVCLNQTSSPDAYPVRVRAGAFDTNIPKRDLLITSEHCVYVDGNLIPIRMLVNGSSIIIDRKITSFSFYHLELEKHGIIIAEGLRVESYLDTGNRLSFSSETRSALNCPRDNAVTKTWEGNAAAPLVVAREIVEPIWKELAFRGRMLGWNAENLPPLVEDPDIHLTTESGLTILPSLFDGSIYAFVIPTGSSVIWLRSRASRPSDIVGPFLDDRRSLGLLVGRIGISNGRKRAEIDNHIVMPELPGWHQIDGSKARWTDGSAQLPLGSYSAITQDLFLDVEVLRAGPYRAFPSDKMAYLPETQAA